MPLGRLISWIGANFALFVGISLLLAASPVLLGLGLDAPLAWARYRSRKPDASFSWASWRSVAKYGDPHLIADGKGRVDVSGAHLAFGLVSNLAGMACQIALFAFLAALPDAFAYLAEHDWTEYLKGAFAIGFFIAYHHTRSLQQKPKPATQGEGYHPDNYRYTRAHVWGISLACIFALCVLGYGTAHFQQIELPPVALWAPLQTAAFLLYANTSPYAVRMQVASIGSLAPGLAACAVGLLCFVVCFRFGLASAAGLGICASLAAGAALAHVRLRSNPETRSWLASNRSSSIYGILIAGAVVAMCAIGIATQAIV